MRAETSNAGKAEAAAAAGAALQVPLPSDLPPVVGLAVVAGEEQTAEKVAEEGRRCSKDQELCCR